MSKNLRSHYPKLEMQMTNKQVQEIGTQHHQLLEKDKLKPQWDTTAPIRIAKTKMNDYMKCSQRSITLLVGV